jgi:aryl-alcohol dehydrogenase-like predicted oxidoreductase
MAADANTGHHPVMNATLALGLAALGRPAYITLTHDVDFPEGRSVEAMETHARRMLDAAYAAGIRHFDAARSYGMAERFLRGWIDARGLQPGEITVSSKWGYRYTGQWQLDGRTQEVKDHSAAMLRAQAAESLALLGPWLTLYQIHSATPESGVLENPEVLEELRRLRAHGLELGVTASGPTQVETIRRAIVLRPLFSAVQATWNAFERSAEEALNEAHAAGLKVLIKEPLANGRLATPPGRDALALAFALRQPWADLVLLGAATEAQLASNLRARDLQLSESDVASLDALREPAADYWASRSKLAWK